MKIATWNVNSLKVRLEQVCDWLRQAEPDVLALQETKLRDDAFPAEAFEQLGYEPLFSGQPTYNGVALIARQAGTDVATGIDGFDDPERRVLAATYGDVRVMCLYVPNGQRVDSDKYRYKLDWLAALTAELRNELPRRRRVVLVGDFNIAPEDRDVHDPAAWEGKVLCSDEERAALGRLMDLGFTDVFRLFEQDTGAFSWWDYRAAAFRRNRGLRIDLVLASETMSRRCTACVIDKEPRRSERPSDHAPVMAEFDVRAI